MNSLVCQALECTELYKYIPLLCIDPCISPGYTARCMLLYRWQAGNHLHSESLTAGCIRCHEETRAPLIHFQIIATRYYITNNIRQPAEERAVRNPHNCTLAASFCITQHDARIRTNSKKHARNDTIPSASEPVIWLFTVKCSHAAVTTHHLWGHVTQHQHVTSESNSQMGGRCFMQNIKDWIRAMFFWSGIWVFTPWNLLDQQILPLAHLPGLQCLPPPK
jgi:hypothetical protein